MPSSSEVMHTIEGVQGHSAGSWSGPQQPSPGTTKRWSYTQMRVFFHKNQLWETWFWLGLQQTRMQRQTLFLHTIFPTKTTPSGGKKELKGVNINSLHAAKAQIMLPSLVFLKEGKRCFQEYCDNSAFSQHLLQFMIFPISIQSWLFPPTNLLHIRCQERSDILRVQIYMFHSNQTEFLLVQFSEKPS